MARNKLYDDVAVQSLPIAEQVAIIRLMKVICYSAAGYSLGEITNSSFSMPSHNGLSSFARVPAKAMTYRRYSSSPVLLV